MTVKYNILPYTTSDGIPTFKDSDIIALYNQMKEEGTFDLVMHDGSFKRVEDFVAYIKQPDIPFFVMYKDTYQTPVAMCWLNRVEKTHTYMHFTGFNASKGNTVEIGKVAMSYVFSMGFDSIMSMIPATNRVAIIYIRKLGFKKLADVPHLLWSEGEQRSVTGVLSQLTREDFYENT